MFDKLTQDLLDLEAEVHGERAMPFAVVFDCCSCSCCGCIVSCD